MNTSGPSTDPSSNLDDTGKISEDEPFTQTD